MSVEDGIAKQVAGMRTPDDTEAAFRRLRAHVRGVLIDAHHALGPIPWTEADDRIIDVIAHWLDDVRGRRSK